MEFSVNHPILFVLVGILIAAVMGQSVYFLLKALRRSGGGGVLLEEEEIAGAALSLARQGIYAEPTSAIVAAAVPEFVARGAIRPGDTVVAVLKGSGLKATGTLQKLLV